MAKALDLSIWMMLHAVGLRRPYYPAPMIVTLPTAPMPRMLELDAIHVSNCAHNAHSLFRSPSSPPHTDYNE